MTTFLRKESFSYDWIYSTQGEYTLESVYSTEFSDLFSSQYEAPGITLSIRVVCNIIRQLIVCVVKPKDIP